MPVSRRTLLLSSAATGAAIAALPATTAAATGDRTLRSDPFTLGVASGDPSHDGIVLWTRLAPEPLAEDGRGGMPSRYVPVYWELAADERFRHVLRRESASPAPSARTASTSSSASYPPGASTSTGSGPAATSPRSAGPAPHPHRGRGAAR